MDGVSTLPFAGPDQASRLSLRQWRSSSEKKAERGKTTTSTPGRPQSFLLALSIFTTPPVEEQLEGDGREVFLMA